MQLMERAVWVDDTAKFKAKLRFMKRPYSHAHSYELSNSCWCDRYHLVCGICGKQKSKKIRHGKSMIRSDRRLGSKVGRMQRGKPK